MRPAWRALVLALLVTTAPQGCAKIDRGAAPTLLPPQLATGSVGLEIIFVRVPLGDPDINGPLWTDIDEQQFSLEARRRLAANGFRAGIIGTRLPQQLEQLLKQTEETPKLASEMTPVTDFENQPVINRKLFRVLGGRRATIICTGEATRHPQMCVLLRGEDGQVNGKTYPKVMGVFATKAFPQGDGRVRLELLPEVEYGDPQRRFEPSDGMIKVEFGPPHETFDTLRMESLLSAGQMLVVSALPDRTGSLGYHFLVDSSGPRPQQKLLLVRLAQTQHDNLFEPDELAGSGIDDVVDPPVEASSKAK